MSGLHVSPDHTSGKTRVRWAIDSVPLCWGKSLQCRLTGEFCCSLTLQSWLAIETLRPVGRHQDLPKFPALVSVPGSSAGDFYWEQSPSCPSLQRALQSSNQSLCSTPTSPQQELFHFHPGVTKFTLAQITE